MRECTKYLRKNKNKPLRTQRAKEGRESITIRQTLLIVEGHKVISCDLALQQDVAHHGNHQNNKCNLHK